MFYKVTTNSELIVAPGNFGVKFRPASGPSIFINGSVHNFGLCVFLLKDTLFYIIDSLILNSQPTALQLRHSWSSSNTRVFSETHITAFMPLGTLDHTPAPCLGGIFNSKEHEKAKHGINIPQEDCLFTAQELKHEGKGSHWVYQVFLCFAEQPCKCWYGDYQHVLGWRHIWNYGTRE